MSFEKTNLHDLFKGEEAKQKSPLELAKEAKEQKGSGIVMNNDDYKPDGYVQPLRSGNDTDEFRAGVQDTLSDTDAMIEAAKYFRLKRPAANELEYINLVTAIDEYKNNKYVSPETWAHVSDIVEILDDEAVLDYSPTTTSEMEETPSIESKPKLDTIPTQPKVESDIDPYADIVTLVMDKTGLGTTEFTEDERRKMEKAKIIRVNEVQDVDIPINIVKREMPELLATIQKHTLSQLTTPVLFLASRYRGYMKGLTFGELSDISLTFRTIEPDSFRKRASILYNNLVDPSVDAIDSFESFMHNTAYLDIDMGVFGLACSTFPDKDEVSMVCRTKNCETTFEKSFLMRSLLRLDKFGDMAKVAMREIMGAKTKDQCTETFNNSPVRRYKRIVLPVSKMTVDLGIISAFDYAGTVLPLMAEEERKSKEDPNYKPNTDIITTILLLIVRAIYVPVEEDSHDVIKVDSSKEMLSILYELPLEDISILARYQEVIIDAYTAEFAYTDIKCPKCGTVTTEVAADINSVVFQKYQTLGSSRIEFNETLFL